MKKQLHFFNNRHKAFVASVFTISLFAAINSSFTLPDDPPAAPQAACTGPFYTTNALGANFSILAPGTGAPNNAGTCSRSGCHNTTADNSGPGVFTIKVDTGITEYVPGTTYPVKVTLTQTGITAMNFQLTTRDANSTGLVRGNFILTDATRTKLTNGNFGGTGISYIEGTACGIDVISAGYNEWTFNWKAPTNTTGDITFYVGAVAANFDNQPTGDHAYSTTLTLSKAQATGIQTQSPVKNNLSVYPNPVTDHLNIDYTLQSDGPVSVKLFDLQGKECGILLDKKQQAGVYHNRFEIDKDKYPAGIYMLRITANNKVIGSSLVQFKD